MFINRSRGNGTSKGIKQKQCISEHIEISEGGIPINVALHYRSGAYFFEMSDVNDLRGSGYRDDEVIKYLTNFVLMYFNYQLSAEDIMIHRIDICRIVDIDDQLVNDFCSGKYATYKSLNNEKGAISRFDRTSVQGHTVYCNYASKKTRVLTLAVYRPCNKRDKNKRLDRNAVKFEFRLKYESIKTRYAFGKKVTPLSLIASIEQDSAFIQKTFDRILASRKIKP